MANQPPEKRISAAQLAQHLGADARELAALRLLFGPGDFPQADAAMALQHLRRNRRPTAPAPMPTPPRPPKRAAAGDALLRQIQRRGTQARVPQVAGRLP